MRLIRIESGFGLNATVINAGLYLAYAQDAGKVVRNVDLLLQVFAKFAIEKPKAIWIRIAEKVEVRVLSRTEGGYSTEFGGTTAPLKSSSVAKL